MKELNQISCNENDECDERFLRIAKLLLLGEHVDEDEKELVKKVALDEDRYMSYCIPPHEFLNIEPDDGEVNYDDDCNDHENKNYDGDNDLAWDSATKEVRDFGLKYDNVDGDSFRLAKRIWNEEPIIISGECDVSAFTVDSAIEILVEAKVKCFDDFNHIIGLLEKGISKHEGDLSRIKPLRWRLADCYYINEEFDRALEIYESLLPGEKGYKAKPALVSQILNVKLKASRRIKAEDLMVLPKSSTYNMSTSEFGKLIAKTNGYLNVLLEEMRSHGLDIGNMLENSAFKESPNSCFYYSDTVKAFMKKNGKTFNFFNLNVEAAPLKDILSLLFSEMRFLGIQLTDVSQIQEDWIAETDLFYRLKEVFPKEDMVHHYRAAWLWKYQLAIYFPSLKFAIDYRGDAVLNPDNYKIQNGGMEEYLRLYDRTMGKAKKKYGIQVETVYSRTSFAEIVDIIKSHGALVTE